MKRVLKRIWAFGLAVLMCLGITAVVNSASAEFIIADAATDYYSPITATGGTALLGQLHDLITTTHTKYTSYDSIKTYAPITDPGLDGKGVLEFYTHETVMSFSGTIGTWNREHVWCQSLSNGLWGTSGGGSDLHHIRPTESGLNSTRGNNKYGEVTNGKEAWSRKVGGANSELGGWVSGSTFEPLDNVKGDVARIVMYVYTHYNTYSNSIFGGYAKTNGSGSGFGTLKFTNVMTASSESAAISLLLEWNKSDPVDEIETLRNEEVYKIQGNRNPFIDNESYAEAIWGNPDGGTTPDPDMELKSISISPASLNLYVGRSQTLTVTTNPANASNSVSWTSSNEAVATVSASGEVAAKSVGTATITATSTTNSSIKATAQVKVEKSNLTSITIDRDSFSASNSYGFHNWNADGISGIAYIYGGNKTAMQFNKSKDSYYLASTTAAPGPIKSVTVKLDSGEERPWKLLTSDKPYGEVSGKPTNGNDQGTKTVTSSGTTWTVGGEDTYFALTYELDGTSGAAYLASIIVEFGNEDAEEEHICGHVCDICGKCTDETCADPACADKCQGHNSEEENTGLQEFHAAVEAIVVNGTLNERLTSLNRAIIAYQALTDEEKALAEEDIAALKEAINDYNQTVTSLNEEAEKANNAATNRLGAVRG